MEEVVSVFCFYSLITYWVDAEDFFPAEGKLYIFGFQSIKAKQILSYVNWVQKKQLIFKILLIVYSNLVVIIAIIYCDT